MQNRSALKLRFVKEARLVIVLRCSMASRSSTNDLTLDTILYLGLLLLAGIVLIWQF